MAWCHQAPSHYLSQFWPKFLSLYDVTKPQWAQTDVSFCKISVIIVALPMSLEGDIGIALSICLSIRSLVYLSHFWGFFTCPTKPIIWLVSTKWRPFRSGLDVIKIDIQAKPAFADMKDLSPPNVNLKKLYESETKPSEPILIIISPGADPSQDLEDLAKGTIGSDKYHQVSYFCRWSSRNIITCSCELQWFLGYEKENLSHIVISTVLVDGLALTGARKITYWYLKFYSNFAGANELKHWQSEGLKHGCSIIWFVFFLRLNNSVPFSGCHGSRSSGDCNAVVGGVFPWGHVALPEEPASGHSLAACTGEGELLCISALIARFMGTTWGPSGSDRTQVGPMLGPWTLLSGRLPVLWLLMTWWLHEPGYPLSIIITSLIKSVASQMGLIIIMEGISNTCQRLLIKKLR